MVQEAEAGRFEVTLEGPSIQPGKLPLRDVEKLAPLLQDGLERTTRVLREEPGAARGRMPRDLRLATNLLLVGIKRGSAELLLELPLPQEEEGEKEEEGLFRPAPSDLGQRAMEVFVGGLHDLETATGAQVPQGWDNSVMEIAEHLANFATERQYAIRLKARSTRRKERTARISPDTADRFRIRHAPIRRSRTARGQLIAVDLGSGRIDVLSEDAKRVQCHFDPEASALMDRVKKLIGEKIDVSGQEEFDVALGKAGKLEVESLEPASEQVPFHEMFWQNKSSSEQAREQGVGPIRSITELAAPVEFSDEELDTFIQAIQESRRSEE